MNDAPFGSKLPRTSCKGIYCKKITSNILISVSNYYSKDKFNITNVIANNQGSLALFNTENNKSSNSGNNQTYTIKIKTFYALDINYQEFSS